MTLWTLTLWLVLPGWPLSAVAGTPTGVPVAALPAAVSLEGLSAEQAGLALFREKDRRDSGYQDLQVDLEMVLRDRRGAETRRELRISQLEVEGDGDRLLVLFDTPKPIRGTALLSYSHHDQPDDQWLYLPAQTRVKKIASRNKSGPFLSSEFAYEDMTLQELEKFSYRRLDDAPCGERTCYQVERVPTDPYSGYSRQEVLLDPDTLRVEGIRYFDVAGRPLKVLSVGGYALYQDRFWKPGSMRMENLQTGRSTELLWRNYQFAVGLSADRDFSTNSLLRAR